MYLMGWATEAMAQAGRETMLGPRGKESSRHSTMKDKLILG